MRKATICFVFSLMCCFPVTPAVGQAKTPREWDAEVARRLPLLSSNSEEERTAGSDWIMNSEPEALPAIEVAAKQAGADSASGKVLSSLLVKLRPLAKLRAKRAALINADYEWNKRTALESYEKVGSRNPLWDEEAKKAIRQFVSLDRAEMAASFATLVHLDKDLNCDDPLIAYLDARMQGFQPTVNRLEQINAYLFACKGLEKSGYPAERKCYAYGRFVQFLSEVDTEKRHPEIKALGERFAKQALDLWPQAVSGGDASISSVRLAEVADIIVEAQLHYGADRGKIIEQMLPPLEKAFPKASVAMSFAGSQYIKYAWDARGTGYANSVTPEGGKLMAERLAVAERLLKEAYRTDPSDASAATYMINCELGQGRGKDVMELWFQRAIAADPGHFDEYNGTDAYRSKLYYLEPKWYGSLEECLAFGRECAATHNYRDNVSDVLLDAHRGFAEMAETPKAYWRYPEVWADVNSVLLPQVKADPQNSHARTKYAYWACQCEQWKIADEQFKLLGDRLSPIVWPTKEASDAARQEASQKSH
jgi:hypothetical protein